MIFLIWQPDSSGWKPVGPLNSERAMILNRVLRFSGIHFFIIEEE